MQEPKIVRSPATEGAPAQTVKTAFDNSAPHEQRANSLSAHEEIKHMRDRAIGNMPMWMRKYHL